MSDKCTGIGDYQGLAADYEAEIQRLQAECERLRDRVMFQAYVSGMWYLNRESAGTVSAIMVDNFIFQVMEDPVQVKEVDGE